MFTIEAVQEQQGVVVRVQDYRKAKRFPGSTQNDR